MLLIQLPIFFALLSAINVMVLPNNSNNIESRAYPFVSSMDRVGELIKKQQSYLSDPSLGYDFKPMLFNTIDLSVKAGFTSINSFTILIFAIGSAYTQYLMAKQQIPSNNSNKKRKFKDLLKDTSKSPSQAEMNDLISRQTSIMMPIMMLLIVINMPGALALYYLLTNTISVVQQKIVLDKTGDEMEISADKAGLKELHKIKEAEVIENKKTGTKITRITAKDSKRRKS